MHPAEGYRAHGDLPAGTAPSQQCSDVVQASGRRPTHRLNRHAWDKLHVPKHSFPHNATPTAEHFEGWATSGMEVTVYGSNDDAEELSQSLLDSGVALCAAVDEARTIVSEQVARCRAASSTGADGGTPDHRNQLRCTFIKDSDVMLACADERASSAGRLSPLSQVASLPRASEPLLAHDRCLSSRSSERGPVGKQIHEHALRRSSKAASIRRKILGGSKMH